MNGPIHAFPSYGQPDVHDDDDYVFLWRQTDRATRVVTVINGLIVQMKERRGW